MPAPNDLDPDAMTEDERIDKKRRDAAYAFSTPQPTSSRDKVAAFHYGTTERA